MDDLASTKQAINLSVLRRHDPFISVILDTSSHVTVYDFDAPSQAWTKRGIEGTMFVFQRTVQPMFGFFVMNRLGIDNLMISLSSDLHIEMLGDYLMYKLPDGTVQGLWMFENSDRRRLAKTLGDLARIAISPMPLSYPQQPQQTPIQSGVMLVDGVHPQMQPFHQAQLQPPQMQQILRQQQQQQLQPQESQQLYPNNGQLAGQQILSALGIHRTDDQQHLHQQLAQQPRPALAAQQPQPQPPKQSNPMTLQIMWTIMERLAPLDAYDRLSEQEFSRRLGKLVQVRLALHFLRCWISFLVLLQEICH
ncbi:hypothetical protein BC831DRAFT_444977 [Entophlyctis helioformis]|nr:hypothetical protein BC831DRAFT_444977 [Entophlyctis helioformis]